MTLHAKHPKYRPDIDGLRAIAVLSVVAFHAFPNWAKGGFIGVDVFFVISGYLITLVIYENLDKESFSLTQFYARRIRRIFPALILVLISCLVIGWFTLLADEFQQLGKHVAASAGFVSNLIFWQESGYFDNAAETKIMLHLWTLGIEEQFYLVWPVILWLAWKRKIDLFVVTLFLAVASFFVNLQSIKLDAVGTFFSPQTRLWELLVGSLLAWCSQYRKKTVWLIRNKIGMNILSLTGLMLLLFGFWQIDNNSIFPGMLALVPVTSALLIIMAGSQGWISRIILSNKIAVWFGLISFPLYLWHWPLLTFARIVEGQVPSLGIRLWAIALAVLLAWLTYKFVECPIRRGKHNNVKTIVLVVMIILVGFVGYDVFENKRIPIGAANVELLSRQIGWTLPAGSPEQIDRCKSLFPERTALSPRERDDNFCMLKDDSAPNVLMVGDSMNLSLFPGLNLYEDFNVLVLSASSAAPFYNIRTIPLNDTIRLNNYKLTNQALDFALSNEEIRVVIMSFANGPLLTDPNYHYTITNILEPTAKDLQQIFTNALASTLNQLLAKNKRVIFVLPNPDLSYDIKCCLNEYRPVRLSYNDDKVCAEPVSAYLDRGGREYREWVASVLINFPQVKVFDAAKPLCDEDKCWGMKDGKVLYRDSAHLSIDGSEYVSLELVSMIRESLKAR